MQDRHRQIDEILLRRTAGPYIGVISDKTHIEHNESAYPPIADMKADRAQPSARLRVSATRYGRAPQRLCWQSSGLPFDFVPENGVEHGDELSCDRDQDDHFGLARGAQPVMEPAQGGIPAHGAHGAHEQDPAYACPPAPDVALATPRAGLTGERRKAH